MTCGRFATRSLRSEASGTENTGIRAVLCINEYPGTSAAIAANLDLHREYCADWTTNTVDLTRLDDELCLQIVEESLAERCRLPTTPVVAPK